MKKYFQAPWSIKDVTIYIAIIIGLIALMVMGLNLSGASEYIENSANKSFFLLGIFLAQGLVILAPPLLLTAKKYKLKKDHFSIKKIGIGRTIYAAISGYLTYIGITIAITAFILFTNIKIPGYQMQENVLEIFGDGTLQLIIAGIVIVGITPIIEEVFFRGIILGTFVNRIGVVFGSIFTAGIFAVFHMQWQSIIPIFILGLIINQLVIRHKSIYPAIAFHALNNGIAFFIQVLIIKEVIRIDELI